MFDTDAAYLAIKARDARFDGRLFVGVTSTGIYCRPICRVRTPRRENCRFFDTAAQAEAQDFRPCLKCRPEIAPGARLAWSVMDASRTLALQAARWLDDHASNGHEASVEALAQALGVTDRHLRRIFAAEHGVTPLQYLQTRRLLLAKQLLTDTALPVTQVALASGFRSLRRFNAAFAERYRLNPGALRKRVEQRPSMSDGAAITLHLAYREPYQTSTMLAFLAQRAIPRVECVNIGGREPFIRRSLRWTHEGQELSGWMQVRFMPDRSLVGLDLSPTLAPASAAIIRLVRRWLDLDAMPDVIDAALHDLPFPGARLPGSIDTFEMTVRAVLGQQVTVASARTLATRLAQRFGTPITTPWNEVDRVFPSPEVLAACSVSDIAELGIVKQRAAAILAIAAQWGELARMLGSGQMPEALLAQLQALPGIGPWTGHYIAMRALAWPDAFPPGDVAVLKAMAALFGTASVREADLRARAWSPWRAYAVVRLWASLRPHEPVTSKPST